ncbi:MAG TPA: C25 family cysteine peptidase [Candidatus Thermoplasmatota archaeon]|nr:C25 family cysteine peptidase [Candidatus Thermoplasmatota archaeon]
MKKFIPIVIVSILVLSGLGAAAFTTNVSTKQATNIKTESTSVIFSSQPALSEKDGFVEIQLDGATTQLLEQNRPVLPVYVKTYQIPFRSTDIQVVCTVKDISSLTITQEIIPARIAPLSTLNEQTAYMKDPAVYGSSEFYPSTWYSYDLGAGRNENDQQVTFVKVICYPVRYSPVNNEISLAGGFDVMVTYNAPQTPHQSSAEDYDMVIIAPEKFSSSLQPLIDFKNTKGVITKFKSVESILTEYDGFDAPEQIKYFIKNEYDNSNITYVTLVGALKSHLYVAKDKDTRSAGWTGWLVPARYVSMPQEEDEGCLSDLYYGCLYNATGFDSWDSNGDGVYAAWNAPGAAKDTFDMYPEVYVSRIPAVTVKEVKAVVKKITTYESTGPADKAWFKNFVGVGGKTFAYYQGKPDGEYLCDLAYNHTKNAFPDLTLTRCYSVNRDTGGRTPVPKDILKSFNEGAGFVDFEGHGNPYSWNTIWFDGTYPEDWTGGFNVYASFLLSNGNKLPIIVVGGCHNALYNVSLIPTLLETQARHEHFCYGIPDPTCFSAAFILKTHGGGIGSTGCTGYGFGNGGDPNTLSGALEMNFFYQIGNGTEHLAQAHSLAITKFINENPIDQIGAFCITNWALFGDASLKIGGYSS